MSLTRKASSAAKKATKPPRDKLAAALAEREAELAEARRQRTATSDILRAIASSPGDLQPVLDRLAEVSCHLCEAYDTLILLRDGDDLRFASHFGPVPLPRNFTKRRIAPDWPAGRAMVERRTIHVHDLAAAQDEYPFAVQFAKDAAGTPSIAWRSVLSVPLLREGEPVGVVALRRVEVWPFTQAQIELMESFVPQAVIAIENSRLFHEAQEALERQTATAEILRVISQSLTDARPVFERIVVTAVRLLHCDMGIVLLREGDTYVHAVGATQAGRITDLAPERFPIDPDANFPSRAILSKEMLYLPDWSRVDLPEHERNIRAEFGVNSALYLPLLREGECIGALALIGNRPNSFGSKEIAHGELFCDQALIAIENARLFHETQESLERQTATAEVLKVIAGSPSNVQPVFEAIAATANRLLGGLSTTVWRFVDDALVLVAFTRTSPSADEALQAAFPRPIAEFPPFALARDGETGQVIDTEAELGVPRVFRDLGRLRGFRSMLFGPLMNDGAAIGMISVTRREPGAFVPADVQLLRTFADQAVIAINNVGLFNETQEALEQQRASAEVLGAISKSIADASPVFETILDACQRLFGSEELGIYTIGDDQMVRAAAWRGPRAEEARQDVTPLAESMTGQVIRERRQHHIPDLGAVPNLSPTLRDRVNRHGSASLLYAPMLQKDIGLGSIVVVRWPPRPFSDREQALLKTFADQAVIAVQNARLFNETQEALQQQTATSDILRVIASSPGDLQPVLDRLAETTCRLCGANDALIFLRDGGDLRLDAHYGPIPTPPSFVKRPIGRDWVVGRALVDREPVHVHDLAAAADEFPLGFLLSQETAGAGTAGLAWRTTLAMPLMREGEAAGVISLRRVEVWPFTDAQIALLRTFADQAVIAIENARLFDEVRDRTRDLTEALQQQTATADVLKAISRTAFDLDTVLGTLISTAAQLSGAEHGQIFRRHGDVYRYAGSWMEVDPAYLRHQQGAEIRPGRGTLLGRVALENRTVQIADAWNDPEYSEKDEVRQGNLRAMLGVPLMRNGEPIGAFALARNEPVPFTQRQVELVTTFADQAVIAIENVRLFDEVQARTKDLQEALQQQTATADVLKVISRSAFDLQLVLDTLVSSAARLCEVEKASIFQRRGELFHWASHFGYSEDLVAYARTHPFSAGANSATARVARDRATVHIPDVLADPDYTASEYQRLGNYRTILGVPLLRDGELIGVFIMTREAVRPFNHRQIELLTTFADQAVIAIQNARLLDEVQARTRDLTESLEQQTAAGEILRVISSSPTDVQPVFDAIAHSAASLCEATNGTVFRLRDGLVHLVGHYSLSQEQLASVQRSFPAPLDRGTASGRAILSRAVVHIHDIAADPEYSAQSLVRTGLRSVLSVPMLRNGELIGSINVSREELRPFSDRQIELLKTFADQAVIAVNNVGLFNETRAALERQTATAEILRVISQSPTDARPVFERIVETASHVLRCEMAAVLLCEGDVFVTAAAMTTEGLVADVGRTRVSIDPNANFPSRAIVQKKAVHLPDWSLIELPEHEHKVQARWGINSALYLPLLREGECIGALALVSKTANAFGPEEIAQAESFRDQAVIAIENARLFAEVQARTRDLTEALQQQTATSDILRVIASSPGDLQPVLDKLAETACRLCGAYDALVLLREGDQLRAAAHYGPIPVTFASQEISRGLLAGRAVIERRAIHIDDIAKHADEYPVAAGLAARGAAAGGMFWRANLVMPLMREGEAVGVIGLRRAEAVPFSDGQIDLLKTFSDQAVIAIENVRLFDEVQARTRELSEALEHQTATSEVLSAISRSPTEVQPVFDAIAKSATELCGATSGGVDLFDGELIRLVAHYNWSPEALAAMGQIYPAAPGRGFASSRAILTRSVVHIPDISEDPEYTATGVVDLGFRSVLAVPMLRDGQPIGVIALVRLEPRAFTDRQIALLQTFAEQAVIAINNVRLFDEVQARTRDLTEALKQQTATADVLKVISRSAFDLDSVLRTLTDSARSLSGAATAAVFLRDGDVYPVRAEFGGCSRVSRVP